jgi:predicted metal-dependent hydrolase
MKKSDRIENLVASLGADPALALHPCYQGYFTCFNAQQYYEAHDVLEHLWLREDRASADHAFFKGLIQFAGAFVHLQKHHAHPAHAKHGRRLRPAVRLFALAAANLAPYAPRHLRLDVAALLALGQQHADAIARSGFTVNPWQPGAAPTLHLAEAI